MQASEWWKWFWRFAVLAELSGIGVGFVAMAFITQTPDAVSANPMEALGHLSVSMFFAVAALGTCGVACWLFLVTIPVLVVSEVCFLRVRRKRREVEHLESLDRIVAGGVLGGIDR